MTCAVLALLPIQLQALPCGNYEYDMVSYFADIKAKQIIDEQYDGGEKIKASVYECNYNSYKGNIKAEIGIEFYGQLSGDYYFIRGDLSMDKEGNNQNFSTTYENDTAKSWKNTRTWLAVGAAVAVANSSSDSSLKIHNKCSFPVDFYIDSSDIPQIGHWIIQPDESGHVTYKNEKISIDSIIDYSSFIHESYEHIDSQKNDNKIIFCPFN